MSLLPDPINVLLSLQQALKDGMVVDPSELDANYKMFYDEPFVGGKRYTFAKIINDEAQAMSIFGLEDPIDGVVCYNVGYAVMESHRGRGLALEAVSKGIEKLKNELNRTGLKSFYIEAVIDVLNIHSINVAKKLFSSNGVAMNEGFTGTPSLYFKSLICIR
ncbi:MAG: GNAT family N-acetyltransferase [Bdellovibrionales bacterium CG11_big_fil_rev_8_21_14_0_20_38_13]|nr:MAG: GNAT family N-acetyltransferase [Bdellovibrionales bacterium CG22_combo_CG10-13_8_21_14_all_38_13]PIR30178.1 MAG: GNAT family N-acetyltransferase [Bdellovibrionales bacterium CG11_big_fil_rev_8_21_14_0_20_38_13]